ncbi:MAG TPA: oligosaccharide flippase family protein, partial [Candidatus Nanoarchaeia archaeon]|nr:oligosaccharide flippase family protein [Candidatus Nanoarchaeia archaeon]
MATYTKKLVRGSAIILFMSVFGSFLGFLARILLARNLSTTEYGLFYAVFAFVSFFLFFRDFGLNQALAKFIPGFIIKKEYNKIKTAIVSVFTVQLISTTIFGVLLYVFSDFLAAHYFKDAAASFILKVFILYVLFSMAFMLLVSILQGFQRIIVYSSAESLRSILMLGMIFFLFTKGLGIAAPTYGFAISYILVVAIFIPYFLSIFHFFSYKIVDFKNMTKKLFAFSLPVLLTSIGARAIARMDTLVLTYFVSLDQVGIYNVAMPIALLLLFFADAVSSVSLPLISELHARKDHARIKEWVRMLYKYSILISAP